MILIFGGAYQGKLDYALEKYRPNSKEIFHCTYDNVSPPAPKRVIYGLDKWLYALVAAERDCEEAIRSSLPDWENSIIICNDISGGVVPADPLYRRWREAAGRGLSLLSAESDEVVRVFCGIGTKLK